MKKTMFGLIASAIALMTTSCASYQNSAAVMGIQGNTIHTEVAADLDLDNAQKVEGVVETRSLFGISLIANGNKTLRATNRYGNLSKREAQALYRAQEASGADVILEPQFQTERHSYFFGLYRTSITKVKGWGVKIKRLRDATR